MTRYYEEIRNHYKLKNNPVAVWNWATRSEQFVPCDGCGIEDVIKVQNVMYEYVLGYGLWVHVLCVKCFDNYAGN